MFVKEVIKKALDWTVLLKKLRKKNEKKQQLC